MTWFTANVTLTNGSQLVKWNSGDPILKLNARDGLIVNGGTPIEVLSIGSVDFLLKNNWPGATATVEVTAQPTAGDFTDATEKLREVSIFASSLYGQLTDWAAASTANVTITDAAGVNTQVPTPKALTDVIETLGSAANADVTTSNTDTTANRLLKVGDFGLGELGNAITIDPDLTTQIATGFYRGVYSGGVADNIDCAVLNMRSNTSRQAQLAIAYGGGATRAYIQSMASNDTWQPMVELYHSGNSVNPLNYGVGTDGSPTIADFAAEYRSGNYSCVLSSVGNSPNTAAYFGAVSVIKASDGRGVVYLVSRVTSSTAAQKQWIGTRTTATGAVFWSEFYHSGNSVNPLDYGIGSVDNTQLKKISIDTATESGVYTGYAGLNANATTGDNPFKGNSGGFSLLVVKGVDDKAGTYTTQTAIYFSGASTVQQKTRTVANGTWGDWVTVYNSDNTNFNVFGGVQGGDVIAQGVATSTTQARIYLPINSTVSASGITVIGSFELRKPDGSLLASSISLSFNGLSSNRTVVLILTGATGLVVGDAVDIRTTSPTDKITVNY
jgi:hypothetical protein